MPGRRTSNNQRPPLRSSGSHNNDFHSRDARDDIVFLQIPTTPSGGAKAPKRTSLSHSRADASPFSHSRSNQQQNFSFGVDPKAQSAAPSSNASEALNRAVNDELSPFSGIDGVQ